MLRLILESIVVGLVVLIVGTIVKFSLDYRGVKKNYFIILFFLVGLISHLLFELVGLNKYYCRYGNACRLDLINLQ